VEDSSYSGVGRRGVARWAGIRGDFGAVLVLIETVGAAQMEVGSSKAQEAKRVPGAWDSWVRLNGNRY
jgi:hypothetical protein